MVMSMSPSMTVSPSSLHSCHQSEPGDDCQGSHQALHPVLVHFVTVQHLEEGNVKEGPGGQPLEDPDDQDVLAGCGLHVSGDQDSYQDSDWRVDAEDDHVYYDLRLLHVA